MSIIRIDGLCQDWLQENYGESTASEYTRFSLVIPMWYSPELNDTLEDLKLELCLSSGSEQSFGTTDYYEAREKLGSHENRNPVPDVFVRAFARN